MAARAGVCLVLSLVLVYRGRCRRLGESLTETGDGAIARLGDDRAGEQCSPTCRPRPPTAGGRRRRQRSESSLRCGSPIWRPGRLRLRSGRDQECGPGPPRGVSLAETTNLPAARVPLVLLGVLKAREIITGQRARCSWRARSRASGSRLLDRRTARRNPTSSSPFSGRGYQLTEAQGGKSTPG
jgi:hypothetical protein